MHKLLASLALLLAAPVAASATGVPPSAHSPAGTSPVGTWLVKDHTARIAIAPCGADLCGKVNWTDNGKLLGQSVLVDMVPDGARWTGTVIDVRDGSRYLAHIAMKSPGELKLSGCVMHGLICKGEVWTRTP